MNLISAGLAARLWENAVSIFHTLRDTTVRPAASALFLSTSGLMFIPDVLQVSKAVFADPPVSSTPAPGDLDLTEAS